MSSNDVQINIIAQDSTKAGLQSVSAGVERTSGVVDELVGKINAIKSAGSGSGDAFKNLASQAVIAQQATDKLANNMHAGFGRSTQTLQDMGRIIQDMPYGIMGIGNNIQPLVESFGRLKAETGSAGGAIQALITGIGGPAGLAMIGIPIVTSLAIVFAGPLMKALAGAGESVDELKARLAGLAQYENLTLKISMSGVEGAKRDLISLIGLQERLRIMQYESGLGKALKDASALPNAQHTYGTTGRYFAGGIGGDPVMQGAQANAKDLAIAKAKADIKAYEYETVQKIWKGEISFGETENLRRLEAANIDKAAAEKRLKLLKAGADVQEAQNKYDVSAAKEKETLLKKNLATAKSAESVTARAAEQDQPWARAVEDADKALGKIGSIALPSIEVATERVIKAGEAVTKAQNAGESVLNITALKNATSDLNEAEAVKLKTTAAWESAVKRGDSLMAKGADSLISYSDAHQGVLDAEDAYAKIKAMGSGYTLFLVDAEDKLVEARDLEGKAIDPLVRKSKDLSKVFKGVGDMAALFGLSGSGVTGMLEGVNSLSANNMAKSVKDIQSANPGMSLGQAQQQASVQGYAGIAQSLGSVIGGKTGNAISATASGAVTGFSVAGPIGAAVGGVIGLVGSLFGGKSDAQKQAEKEAKQKAEADRAAANAAKGEALKLMSSTSVVGTLDEITKKYKDIASLIGQSADLQKAKQNEMISALTGVTINSLSSVLDSIVTTTKAEDVGAAFSAKITEALSASIRLMQVGTFMQTLIAPVLQPLYANIAQSMAAGTDTSAGFAAIKMALKDLTPQINAFAQSLADQGITADAATVAITNLNTALSNTVSISNSIKSAFKDQYDYAKNILELQKTTYSELADKLRALSSGLNSALESLHPAGSSKEDQTAARVALQSALSGARSTGTLPINGEITSALAVASRMTSASYSNATEYARDLYSTLSTISELDKITGDQLTIAEQQVSWLEKISATLDRSYENTNTAYDKYLAEAKAQVDGLAGIGLSSTVTNKTLASATKEAAKTLKTQMGGFADLVTGIGSVDTGVGTVKDVMSSIGLNQATYEASLKQVAGIYDVNASVSAVNLSIIAMTDSVSQYLSIQAQSKAAEEATAADAIAKAKATAAQKAATAAYDKVNSVQINGSTVLSEGAANVGKYTLSSIQSLNSVYKVNLYADPNQQTYRGYWSPATGFSTATDGGDLSRVESLLIEKLPGYATGGIASGPTSGYPVTMHGTEAIIPMGKGSLPLVIDFSDMIAELQALRGEIGNMKTEIDFSDMIAELQALRGEIGNMKTEMVRRSDVIAQNTGRTKNAIELQNVAAGIAG